MEIVLLVVGLLVVAIGLAAGLAYVAALTLVVIIKLLVLLIAAFVGTAGRVIVAVDVVFAILRGTIVETVRGVALFVSHCIAICIAPFRKDVLRERLSTVDAAWRMEVGLELPGPLPAWCSLEGEGVDKPRDASPQRVVAVDLPPVSIVLPAAPRRTH